MHWRKDGTKKMPRGGSLGERWEGSGHRKEGICNNLMQKFAKNFWAVRSSDCFLEDRTHRGFEEKNRPLKPAAGRTGVLGALGGMRKK